MKIVIISDTHGLHEDVDIVSGDLLIHCGDFEQTAALDAWFHNLEFEQIVVIGGNHDFDAFEKQSAGEPVFFNAEYLQDREIEYCGLKIYGTPWINELEGAAFSLTHDEIKTRWQAIPDDTDILVTHVPPFEILDTASNGENWGCRELRERVEDLSLRFHCFGHVHASYGCQDRFGITFINASSISGGEIRNLPVVIEL